MVEVLLEAGADVEAADTVREPEGTKQRKHYMPYDVKWP